jgi:hypothetical protein
VTTLECQPHGHDRSFRSRGQPFGDFCTTLDLNYH